MVNFFTAQVSPALGSFRISRFVGRSVGHDPTLHWITYTKAYVCLMNHQKTHQTNPMAQWDSRDVPIHPLGAPEGPPRPPWTHLDP